MQQMHGQERHLYATGTRWDPVVGYSRAIRVGPFVYVSGTTATDKNGQIVGQGDPYAQAVQIIKNIEEVLKTAGGSLKDVERKRIYVTNIDLWGQVGDKHGEFITTLRSASAIVEVNTLT